MTARVRQPVQARAGRPRDPALDLALREAALDLLAERGYDQLTIEAVAARSGAGRATVYRRWASKLELVIDALDGLRPLEPAPDSGSLRGDLDALCAQLTRADGGRALTVVQGLASVLGRDPELMDAFNQHFVAPRRAALEQLFRRAVDRGEMGPRPDYELLTAIVPALMLHRMLIGGAAPDPDFALRVIDQVLLPAATAGTPNDREDR